MDATFYANRDPSLLDWEKVATKVSDIVPPESRTLLMVI